LNDLDPHVAWIYAAWPVPELSMKTGIGIAHNEIVGFAAACHGKRIAFEIFVSGVSGAFLRQIGINRNGWFGFCCHVFPLSKDSGGLGSIDFQKIHFARQQGGDYTVVYLRPITQRNYFSESL
jgi:hypothetical protein